MPRKRAVVQTLRIRAGGEQHHLAHVDLSEEGGAKDIGTAGQGQIAAGILRPRERDVGLERLIVRRDPQRPERLPQPRLQGPKLGEVAAERGPEDFWRVERPEAAGATELDSKWRLSDHHAGKGTVDLGDGAVGDLPEEEQGQVKAVRLDPPCFGGELDDFQPSGFEARTERIAQLDSDEGTQREEFRCRAVDYSRISAAPQ